MRLYGLPRRLLALLMGAGLLLATPACDSDVEDDGPEPVDLAPGTFDVTLDGAADETLSGEAGFFTFDLGFADSLEVPIPGGAESPFVVNLAPEGESGPRPLIQLQRLSGGRPSEGTYSAVPTRLTNVAVSATVGGVAYQPQDGTVEVVSSSEEALTGRIDARLAPFFEGSERRCMWRGPFTPCATRRSIEAGWGFRGAVPRRVRLRSQSLRSKRAPHSGRPVANRESSHQPIVPGPPLKGPSTSSVTQPP